MKSLIFVSILIFGNSVNAVNWCDIKDRKTKAILFTYEGECDQRKFAGPWGDAAETLHEVNSTKQKELDDASKAEKAKRQDLKLSLRKCLKANATAAEVRDCVATIIRTVVQDVELDEQTLK